MFGSVAKNSYNEPMLFSVDELNKCDTLHPLPELKYFAEPKNDNEKLFNLQKKYYDARNKGDEKSANALYWDMWLLSGKVAERIIRKIVAARGLEFCDDEVQDKVSETCLYLLRRFNTRINYAVTTNWIVAIKDSVRHALDYQTELEKNTDVMSDFTLIKNGNIKAISGRRIKTGD